MATFVNGRDNLACTIFVPVVCGNNCAFCTSKKDYEGFVYSPEYLNKIQIFFRYKMSMER